MTMRKDWTDAENLAVALAYCVMLAATMRDERFNKSAIRRELIGTEDMPGPLYARSHGSIEAKLMNCSAAAMAVNIPVLKGYKPAPNYQASLRVAMSSAWRLVSDDIDRGINTNISVAII